MKSDRIFLMPLLIILCFAFTICWGCAHYQGEGAMTTIIATSEAFKAFDGEYENTAYFKHHKPESIAVLPFSTLEEKSFASDSEFEHPEDIVRRGLYNHISSLPFKDLEIFQTDTRLKNADLLKPKDIQSLLAENPRKLKSILGVGAVVTGNVTHFDRIYMGIYSQVAVGCDVHMWDLDSGKLLWRAKHVSRAHAGGISINPVGLLLSAAASVWNMRNTEMLSQTDEVFREIVSTIDLPKSTAVSPQSLPYIDLFAVMNAGKPFTAGREVTFRLVGDPNCRAYVDLGDYKSAIPLTPLPPAKKQAMASEIIASIHKQYKASGLELTPDLMAEINKGLAAKEIYEGAYTVEPGEEKYGLTSKAFLISPTGDQVSKIDIANLVDIDAKPPEPPKGLATESLNRKIKVAWLQNSDDNLAGYQIWTSPTPLSGYTLKERVEKNESFLDGLDNFESIYIKVKATDRADNTSRFSQPIESVPLPEPGLYDLPRPGPVLSSDITDSVLLVKEKSPYSVQADIKILPGATLYSEPGVEIRFSPDTSMIVSGGSLVTYGEKRRAVQFIPSAHEAEPGSWNGIVLDNATHVHLMHTRILKAVTGMTIVNSAPEIFASEISRCSQAGLYLKKSARPNIACSTFYSNEGQGALVMSGEGVSPQVRDCQFLENTPFDVQSYTPTTIDLSDNFWGEPVPDQNRFLGNIVWEPPLPAPSKVCADN